MLIPSNNIVLCYIYNYFAAYSYFRDSCLFNINNFECDCPKRWFTKTWHIRKRRKKHLNCFNFPYYNNNKNFTKNQEIFFFSCQHISDPCIIEQTKKSICNLLFVSIIPFPSQGFEGPIFFAITCICSAILTHQGRFGTHTPPFKANDSNFNPWQPIRITWRS